MVFTKRKKAPAGVEPSPRPTQLLCVLCSEYETSSQSSMTRHMKFWCPSREGQEEEEEEVSDCFKVLVLIFYTGTHWDF